MRLLCVCSSCCTAAEANLVADGIVLQVLQNRDAKTFVSCWKAWGKGWGLEYEMTPKIKFTILTGPALELTSNCIGEIKFADGDCYTTTLVCFLYLSSLL